MPGLSLRIAVVGVATVAVFAAGEALVPVQAAPGSGIGSGRAVIRIDSPKASVSQQGGDTYVLTMAKNASGQWMGERTNAGGKVTTRVGDLTAKQLVDGWDDFKYTEAGVDATLTWNSKSPRVKAASVHISQPRSTKAGVVVELTSQEIIPAHLTNASLSISRAPGKGVRSLPTQTQNITSDLWISSANSDASHDTARIYNSTNNNTCFTGSVNSNSEVWALSVGSNTCDNIAYSNFSQNSTYPFGVSVSYGERSKNGIINSSYFNLNITPPGQASYQYTWQFTWS